MLINITTIKPHIKLLIFLEKSILKFLFNYNIFIILKKILEYYYIYFYN